MGSRLHGDRRDDAGDQFSRRSGNGIPGPVGHILDCGNRTSAENRRSRHRFRWCSAGPNCVTNVPPKSWRRSILTYAFWSSIIYMHPDRTKRTFELINMVLQFCVYVEMRFKHALACWRPVEYNAQVQPMITTPGHGSFPERTRDAGPCGSPRAEKAAELNPSSTGTPNGDRTARPPGGAHRDQPCRGGGPFPGRQHGRTHVGRGLGRVFRRALHGGPDIHGAEVHRRRNRRRCPPHGLQSVQPCPGAQRRAVLLAIRGSEHREVRFDGACMGQGAGEWKANLD